MSHFDGIILGIVQGLTEFIPVSSSGHLILARDILGIGDQNGLAFDAVLQLATILAVAVYFRKDLLNLCRTALALLIPSKHSNVRSEEKNLLGAVIFGTVPGIIAGMLLESSMETLFRSTGLVAVMLVLGALLMAVAEWWYKKRMVVGNTLDTTASQNTDVAVPRISIKQGIMIGLFQCLALIPGVSRSGATLSGGLFVGLTREVAARFSFFLAFPIILGSGLKKLLELTTASGTMLDMSVLVSSSIVAFVVGLGAIHFLIRFLKSHTLNVFVVYRLILAAVLVVLVLK